MRTPDPDLTRRRALAAGAPGISTLALPAASASASTLAPGVSGPGATPSTFPSSSQIPYLGLNVPVPVAGVTVTKTYDTGSDGGAGRYLHQSPNKTVTVFQFSSPLDAIRIRTLNHADAELSMGAGAYERYVLDFRTISGNVLVDTATIENADGSWTFTPSGVFDKLDVLYYFAPGAGSSAEFGSYIEFAI